MTLGTTVQNSRRDQKNNFTVKMVHLEAGGGRLRKNLKGRTFSDWDRVESDLKYTQLDDEAAYAKFGSTMPYNVADGRRSNPKIYQKVLDVAINAKTKLKLVQGHGKPRVAVRKEMDSFDERMFDPSVILKPEYNRVVRLKDIV